MDDRAEQTAGLDLRQILALLGKWRWIIILLTGMAVATSAFLSVFVLPKVYEASATLDVSYAAPSQSQGGQQTQADSLQGVIQTVSTLPQNTLETYQWQVTNPLVLQGTSSALGAKGLTFTPLQLQKMVTASIVPNTNLVSISVQNTDPVVAAAVANTLTSVYLSTVQAQDHAKLAQAAGFLQGQANAVEDQLRSATGALAAAQSSAGPDAASQLQAQGQDLDTLRGQLTQADVQLGAAHAGQATLEKRLYSMQAAQTVTTIETVSGKTRRVQTRQPNPEYQALSQQLATQQVTVAEDQATVQGLQAAVSQLQSQVSALAAESQHSQASVQALQSQVDELTQTYQTLMQNLTQAQVADAMSLGSTVVTLTAPAAVPSRPIKPNKKLNVALALVLGLMVSVGLAFLLEQLDNTVKTPEDIERWAGLPTLTVVPHFPE